MRGVPPFALALLVVSGGLAVALVAVPSSGAFYADTGASDRNAVQGESLDGKLDERGPTNGQDSTTDETGADAVRDTWEDRTHDTLGRDNVSNTLTVNNSESTLAADRVDVAVEYAENDSGGTGGNAVNASKTLAVTAFAYAGEDLTGMLADENGNGQLDVDDLTRGSNVDALTGLSGVAAGGTANLTVAVSGVTDLIEGVGAGDGVDVTVTITLRNGFRDADVSTNNTIRYG